ncbi:MAG: L-glutamate gamma-semialdehyde dehydrogenase [Myxococcota bacterium]
MNTSNVRVPLPVNEPIKQYAPGSAEKAELKGALAKVAGECPEIPVIIGGKEIRTGKTFEVRSPFDHHKVLATAHAAGPEQVEQAIAAALEAKQEWGALPLADRAAVMLRAAELLATKYRATINAVTMWGQAKTAFQSEIDAACEAIDFLRFNVAFAQQIADVQPVSAAGTWNQTDYRPLDGFVLAVAPFNFTAIALNLATSPALMGNAVLFKPAETATLSSWTLMKVLQEAGLPDGVINFLPGPGAPIGGTAMAHPDFGGLHFTGSTGTFNAMWKTVGEHMSKYRQYPRIVGETGGKDFIFVHPSAADDLDAVAVAIARGGYEFQGQKCSACSRVYVPSSLWPSLRERLVPMIEGITMGPPTDFRNFMSAVIDDRSFIKIGRYLELAKGADAKILAGGKVDRSVGWYVRPTLVQVTNPRHTLMTEEIFGPVVTVFVYPDEQLSEALVECDQAAPYALTGSIFARDRHAVVQMTAALRHTAGNFYINDKCTGAVVGQQPFGGSRGSGTNDKAGSVWNLLRWTSPRTIKETFVPPTTLGYPFMGAE